MSSSIDDNKEEYTDEELEQISQEIMDCDYYPKEITKADIEDYLEKEANHDTYLDSAAKRVREGGGQGILTGKDRINAEAAACKVVALAITKLAFEGPIILKGFSA